MTRSIALIKANWQSFYVESYLLYNTPATNIFDCQIWQILSSIPNMLDATLRFNLFNDAICMVNGFIPGSIRSFTIIVIRMIFTITATELLTTATLIGPESSDKKVLQTWISPQLFSLSTNLRFFSS